MTSGRTEDGAAEADDAAARTCYAECLTLCRALGEKRVMAYALEGFTDVAQAQEQPERAVRLTVPRIRFARPSALPCRPTTARTRKTPLPRFAPRWARKPLRLRGQQAGRRLGSRSSPTLWRRGRRRFSFASCSRALWSLPHRSLSGQASIQRPPLLPRRFQKRLLRDNRREESAIVLLAITPPPAHLNTASA